MENYVHTFRGTADGLHGSLCQGLRKCAFLFYCPAFEKLDMHGGHEVVLLNSFDDDGRCHTTRSAHGNQTALQVASLKFVKHGANQNRARGANGVAESNGASIDIDFVAIELQVANVFLGHDGEGFIDFEKIDVVQG